MPYAPYFSHVESYLTHEDDPHLLILSYEEMSKDPADSIRVSAFLWKQKSLELFSFAIGPHRCRDFSFQKIATFLGKHLSNEEVTTLVEHTSFNRMKTNPAVNYEHWDSLGIRNVGEAKFYRKGKVGDWHNHFTDRTNAEFDEWLSKSNTKNLKFTFDL